MLPVMGILVFTALMQDTGLMRADQLSLFNKELVCQNALIAEKFFGRRVGLLEVGSSCSLGAGVIPTLRDLPG